MPGFSVDTKLFRELGELLVGRESTALTELIKNAYDADATEVTILGRGIAEAGEGSIIVMDNGIGMSEAEFSRGFLRIAGRGC
ncbi:ATP-binding protein [Mesorhizobium sp. B1-1-8]|uniref:ATP-binding protein n=1 Tax=Mesorhizobium sp. B1-1-8 TaxID=2589976 RepID=UPI0015E41658|nr:ATP-binding protein [Mesorhizobium sp. B1-1-8]UCI07213.1 ATP-binding protein [Mesorhizobium sp. B1-1-8]